MFWNDSQSARVWAVQHVFQRWSVGRVGPRGHPPGTAKGRASHSLLPAGLGGAPDGALSSKSADSNQITHQTDCTTTPSAPHRPKYDEALRAGGRSSRYVALRKPLGDAQRFSVDICAARLGLICDFSRGGSLVTSLEVHLRLLKNANL